VLTPAITGRYDGLNRHRHNAGMPHIELIGRERRHVDQDAASGRTSVGDLDDDTPAVIEVRHPRERVKRQRSMRGGGVHIVQPIAARGAPADMTTAIPCGRAVFALADDPDGSDLLP
jgi:hypothetical protein